MSERHWREYLVRGFAEGQDSTVEIRVNPEMDSPTVMLLASRLTGLVDALRERQGEQKPLEHESPEDLRVLLDHLHRVRMVLQGQEERVLELANRKGITMRDLAGVLDVSSPNTVHNRIQRIRRAGRYGKTAAALDEDPLAVGEPVTDTDEDEE